ncbi:MAG: pyridine nucleotide-disulfide oxidoreductase, partial [Thermoprotei archaeon]
MRRVDAELVVIGGGPAGMAAAIRAWELGLKRVVLIDKEPTLGGILPQCIHPGFGIHVYGEDLTGPEMSERLAERILSTGVDVVLEASVIQFESSYDEKTVMAVSPRGVIKARAKALVYAAGARERT